MSDFCFNVSEHIARETGFPRAEIIEVDKFLAREHRREFKLHDIEDFTNVGENTEAIINEYIRRGTVTKETRYFCPNHKNTILERPESLIPSRKRVCPRCVKSYSTDGLETQTVYVRKKAPDRTFPFVTSTTGEAIEKPVKRWWKDPQWITERIILPIFTSIAVALIIGFFISPLFQTTQSNMSKPSKSATPKSSTTPTSTLTRTIKATPISPPSPNHMPFPTP